MWKTNQLHSTCFLDISSFSFKAFTLFQWNLKFSYSFVMALKIFYKLPFLIGDLLNLICNMGHILLKFCQLHICSFIVFLYTSIFDMINTRVASVLHVLPKCPAKKNAGRFGRTCRTFWQDILAGHLIWEYILDSLDGLCWWFCIKLMYSACSLKFIIFFFYFYTFIQF